MLIFENLALLFFSAAKVFVLFLVKVICTARSRHPNSALLNVVPVDILKEPVLFDLRGTASTCTKTLAWVSVEQVDNQVFGLLGHAHGEFEHATLDIVEQLVLGL